ncbi:MAG: hypothetical protein KAJ19_23940 [Gammaproteobacteria bacterium]|nr:hypothetical protein [Gammaproteobacteria bacterium]
MNGLSQGTEYHEPAEIDGGPPPVRLDPQPPFVLAVHPHRWEVFGKALLPIPKKLSRSPGVNEVTPHGSMKYALATDKERGWVHVPMDLDGRSYVVRHKGHRGPVHLLRFEQCFPGSNRVRCDEKAYHQFLKKIIKAGLVPDLPPIFVLEQMASTLESRMSKLAERAQGGSTDAKTRLKAYQANMKVIQSAINKTVNASSPASGAIVEESEIL